MPRNMSAYDAVELDGIRQFNEYQKHTRKLRCWAYAGGIAIADIHACASQDTSTIIIDYFGEGAHQVLANLALHDGAGREISAAEIGKLFCIGDKSEYPESVLPKLANITPFRLTDLGQHAYDAAYLADASQPTSVMSLTTT